MVSLDTSTPVGLAHSIAGASVARKDFILLINTTPSTNNANSRIGNDIDGSKYAAYETKNVSETSSETKISSPQQLYQIPSSERKQSEHDHTSNNGTKRDEFGEYNATGSGSAALSSPSKKIPHDAEYAAMLLDSSGTQAGPYGFARLHAAQTGHSPLKRDRKDSVGTVDNTAPLRKPSLTPPVTVSAPVPVSVVLPVSVGAAPAVATSKSEEVSLSAPVQKSSLSAGASITSSESNKAPLVRKPSVVTFTEPDKSSASTTSEPVAKSAQRPTALSGANNHPASAMVYPEISPASSLTYSNNNSYQSMPETEQPSVSAVSSVRGVPHSGRASPVVPVATTNVTPINAAPTIVSPLPVSKAVTSPDAASVIRRFSGTAGSANITSTAAVTASVFSSGSDKASHTPTAADKLFQYSHRKSVTTNSPLKAMAALATATTPLTPTPTASSVSNSSTVLQSEPTSNKENSVDSSAITCNGVVAESSAATAPSVVSPANKLFSKYNQHRKPSIIVNSTGVGLQGPRPNPAATQNGNETPVISTTPPPTVTSGMPPAVVAAVPRKSLASLFAQTDETPTETSVVENVQTRTSPSIPQSGLVHHSQMVQTDAANVRRSIGGFRRIKSGSLTIPGGLSAQDLQQIVQKNDEEDEDYGDLSAIKIIEFGKEMDSDEEEKASRKQQVIKSATSRATAPSPVERGTSPSAVQVSKPPLVPSRVAPRGSSLSRVAAPNMDVDPFGSDQQQTGPHGRDNESEQHSKTFNSVPSSSGSGRSSPSTVFSKQQQDVAAPIAAFSPVAQSTPDFAVSPTSPISDTESNGPPADISPKEAAQKRMSKFGAPNPLEAMRSTMLAASGGTKVDNSTTEEKIALSAHENSRTNHYSKLGSAFVSENVLSARGSVGGRGRGAGRGVGIR